MINYKGFYAPQNDPKKRRQIGKWHYLLLVGLLYLLFLPSCSQYNAPDIGSSTGQDNTCASSTCHPATPLKKAIPDSGKHTAHLNSTMGITCSACHDQYLNHPLHKNTRIDGFNPISSTDSSGNVVVFDSRNPNGGFDNTTNTCSNMSCHGDVSWYASSSLTTCTICHYPGSSVDPYAKGQHTSHNSIYCLSCHENYGTSAKHKDGVLDTGGFVSFSGSGAFDENTKSCSALSCHVNNDWDSSDAVAMNSCTDCHFSGGAYDPASSGNHAAHLNTSSMSINCETCHTNYNASASHRNGTIDTTAIVSINPTYSPTWTEATSTCAMSCYSTKTWSTSSTLGCTDCHSAGTNIGAPSSGYHSKHIGSTAMSLSCESCHSGYGSNGNHKDGVNNTTGFVSFSAGSYDFGTKSCSSIGCHTNQVWGTGTTLGCTDCHAAELTKGAPTTAKHSIHLGSSAMTITCTTCHQNYGSAGTHLDNNDQSTDIVTFSGGGSFTDASSTCSGIGCHSDAVWNDTSSLACLDCHYTDSSIDPRNAATGFHSKHLDTSAYAMSCNSCHMNYDSNSNHKNGTLNSSSSVSIDPSFSGTYTAGSCSINCHADRAWVGGTALGCTDCHNESVEKVNSA